MILTFQIYIIFKLQKNNKLLRHTGTEMSNWVINKKIN